jgi:uncharacterized protein (TIGR03118 family)
MTRARCPRLALAWLALAGLPGLARGQYPPPPAPMPTPMPSPAPAPQPGPGTFVVTPLISDVSPQPDHTDANLVNGWGIAAGPSTFWWVSDNGTGKSTLYDGNGSRQALVVTIPGPGMSTQSSTPTGIVFNGGPGFAIGPAGAQAPATFLFATEDGTISAWNQAAGTKAALVIDRSGSGAVYKGLALAHLPAGGDRLYATNFRAGAVEMWDGGFAPATGPAGAATFADPSLPAGYAPFGIQVIGPVVLVSYALQDDQKHADVPGAGHGFIDAFNLDGVLIGRVVSGGKLDSPWGMALAPLGFGGLGGSLLVGNFGDGHLVAYTFTAAGNQTEGAYVQAAGGPVAIDGLWGIGFGNGARAGPATTLFFAAGPSQQSHGLFGRIDPG